MVGLFLWILVTFGHFWHIDRVTRSLRSAATSLDERIFVTTLGGVATLSCVLHVAASTVGLGLVSGIAGLIACHVVLSVVTDPASRIAPPTTLVDRVALAVLFGILLSWIGAAAASIDLRGPDAAHYHVPYAVNIAAGDSLFGLPATPHLYPMAGSVIAAWFIVPLGDPLLVDLAMVLPFALLVASVNYLVRMMTGVSGTAWASWLTIALFATPLFRNASAGAADLWFAASFAGALAVVVAAVTRGLWRNVDIVLLGGAVGLLVGSKTTGVAAAGLLALGAALVSILRAAFGGSRRSGDAAGFGSLGVAAIVALGAGGIWLLRNWIQFGSPLAPAGLQLFGWTVFEGETHQGTTYLSVLGEMQTTGFDIRTRGAHYVREWLGPVFLPSLALVGLSVVDLGLTFSRRSSDPRWWARAACLILVLGIGSTLVWMLIGAPWTALERSRGLTLRYALPVATLLPVLAFTALLPLRWPWFESQSAMSRALLACLAAASLWSFWRSAAGPDTLPPLDLAWLGVSGAAVMTAAAWRPSGRVRSLVTATAALALCAFWTATIVDSHRRERERTAAGLRQEEAALASGTLPGSQWRTLYLTVRRDERGRGVSCGASRFFSVVRDDEPMALQPPEMTNRSYYAGREVESARRAGPIDRCDYIVTTAALQATEKGQNIAKALSGGAELATIETGTGLIALRLR